MGSSLSSPSKCFIDRSDLAPSVHSKNRNAPYEEFDLSTHREYLLDCGQLMDDTHARCAVSSISDSFTDITSLSTNNSDSSSIAEHSSVPELETDYCTGGGREAQAVDGRSMSTASTPDMSVVRNAQEGLGPPTTSTPTPMPGVDPLWSLLQSPHYMYAYLNCLFVQCIRFGYVLMPQSCRRTNTPVLPLPPVTPGALADSLAQLVRGCSVRDLAVLVSRYQVDVSLLRYVCTCVHVLMYVLYVYLYVHAGYMCTLCCCVAG